MRWVKSQRTVLLLQARKRVCAQVAATDWAESLINQGLDIQLEIENNGRHDDMTVVEGQVSPAQLPSPRDL